MEVAAAEDFEVGRPVMRIGIVLAVALVVACSKPGPTPTSASPSTPPPTSGSNGETIRQLLAVPEENIDFAVAKVTIDKMIDSSIDVAAVSQQIDQIAGDIRAHLPPTASSQDRVNALRGYLYEPGLWNGNRPFHYDLDDPLGRNIRNKLLSTYLSTRKGNCISMPLLFIVLGQKLGIDVTAGTAPEHVFVKYRDESGTVVNLETTSGAGVTSDGWIQKNMPMSAEALSNGIYLRRLSKKETVVVMLYTLMEHYGQTQRQEERIALGELALQSAPKDVAVMMQIHAGYGQLLFQKFRSKYAMPRDIPISERQEFMRLDSAGQLWLHRAEALGWREPDAAEKAQYEQSIKTAKAAQ